MYDEINELQRQWRKELPRYSDAELKEIFPEHQELLNGQITEARRIEKYLGAVIKWELKQIRENTTDLLSQWFWKQWLDETLGKEYRVAQKNRRRIERLLRIEDSDAGHITDHQISHAKQFPIESLASSVQRGWGDRMRALCPFHDDSRPSLVIYKDSNRYWCFVCNEGGDAINFIQRKHGLSFPEAVKQLIHEAS